MVHEPEDEMSFRARMEASEDTGLPRGGGHDAGLQRVDPARVAHTRRFREHAAGYARLELMLDSVMPRLLAEPPCPEAR